MQAGAQSSVPIREQESEFRKSLAYHKALIVLFFAFYMQYKNTTEIKERILIAIAPSCLNIFLFSRWLSICSFSLLGLAFQCESLGAWHINPEHTGWCPSHAVSAKCLLQEWWIFMPL